MVLLVGADRRSRGGVIGDPHGLTRCFGLVNLVYPGDTRGRR